MKKIIIPFLVTMAVSGQAIEPVSHRIALTVENGVAEGVLPASPESGNSVQLAMMDIPVKSSAPSLTAVLSVYAEGVSEAEWQACATVKPSKRSAFRFDLTPAYRDGFSVSRTIRLTLLNPNEELHCKNGNLRLFAGAACRPSTKDLLRPLWAENSVIINEPAMLLVAPGEQQVRVPLLAPARRILEVRVPGGQTLIAPEPWSLESPRTLLLNTDGLPTLTPKDLFFSEQPLKCRTFPSKNGGFFLSSENGFAGYQVLVTYEPEMPAVSRPLLHREHLEKTRARLKAGYPFTMALFGDSISVGANVSSRADSAPFQPVWGQLLADGLTAAYLCPIQFLNPSMGGAASNWGADKVGELVAPAKPDLVVLAFGMNDRISAEKYSSNIRQMITAIRTASPDCEFILVGSMQPNPDWKGTRSELTRTYAEAHWQMEGPGSAVVDMWHFHSELLKYKRYLDLTGNNANHPNDFLSAAYAQLVYELLRPDKTEE